MADWTFATGDSLTRKAWADTWWIEAKTDSFFYGKGFVGPSEENFIVELKDLEFMVSKEHAIDNEFTVLRRGKKKYALIKH